MNRYKVIAEFVDALTGSRVKPPGFFAPHDQSQAARLIKAGCLIMAEEPQGLKKDDSKTKIPTRKRAGKSTRG